MFTREKHDDDKHDKSVNFGVPNFYSEMYRLGKKPGKQPRSLPFSVDIW